jgi:elongation factor P
MKIDGNEIRPGNVIEHQKRLWRAVKTQHVKPGKGGAFLQVELRDIRDGTKLNERFRSSEAVERVRLDQKEYQYLFSDGTSHTFMDQENYEQITLDENILDADQSRFLQDGMVVQIESYEEETIGVALPERVTLEVVEADPVVKGQTATSSYKPATLENGVRIQVPPHVEAGTAVVVLTADGTYVERARN